MDEGWPKYSFYDITCLPHDTVLPMLPANSTSVVLTGLRNATYVITLAAVSVAGGLDGRGLPTDIAFGKVPYHNYRICYYCVLYYITVAHASKLGQLLAIRVSSLNLWE